MLTAIEQFFINHATAITTIAAIADIFAVLATIWIAFLTYQNIRESRRATIVAQEKKNVIEACQYAIQFTVLLEKCEEEFKKINIIPKSFWSKDLENEYGSNMIYAETVTPVKKAAQKRMSMITSNNMEEINKIEEIIDKIKEPIHRKVTELRTVSAFLPEDANKQIHFLQSYYKHLGGINNFLSKNEGEIVTKIDKFMESQQKKLEEMGFSSSTAYFESLQKYFHENIKSVIANKKFSLHNLAKQWVPYESFIKNNL